MNDYSITQRMLHHIALEYNFLREVFFDVEKTLFLNDTVKKNYDDHVFVTGMARSGTTVLLNAIYESNSFASLTYQDMPFILSPNLWSKINKGGFEIKKQERAHGDGIRINTSSPEAFEEVFWSTFNHKETGTVEEFNSFISLLCKKYGMKRYLSKNNQNIRRIDFLIKNYPNSKILIPFRNPLQHSNSLFQQHCLFNTLQKKDNFIKKYMFWIGHSEFGLDYIPFYDLELNFPECNLFNHWLEQWYLTYDNLKKYKGSSNLRFVCYEQLCSKKETFQSIIDFIDVGIENKYEFRLSSKEIEFEYDTKLYQNCLNVYEDLK